MKKWFILSTTLYAISYTAAAQEAFTGGYLGGEISSNKQDFSLPYSELNSSRESAYQGTGSRTVGIGLMGGYGFKFGSNFIGQVESKITFTNNKTKDANGERISKEDLRVGFHYLQGYKISNVLPYIKLGLEAAVLSMNNTSTMKYYGAEFENSNAYGFSYGAGIKYQLSDELVLGVDYTKTDLRALDGIKLKSSSVGLNMSYHF